MIETIKAMTSANTTDNQIPFKPNIIGKTKIAIIWNNNVLTNEMIAEIKPLLREVKNEEQKILNPKTRNAIEYNLKPLAVIFKSSTS